jgi:hypothetical protein
VRKRRGATAEALTAFCRGEDTEEADVGAMIVADAYICLRVIAHANGRKD